MAELRSTDIINKLRKINGKIQELEGQINSEFFGICSTESSKVNKIVTDVENFVLKEGASISIQFINGYSETTRPSLSVNGTTTASIYKNGDLSIPSWNADEIIDFIYNGTNWIMFRKTTVTVDEDQNMLCFNN